MSTTFSIDDLRATRRPPASPPQAWALWALGFRPFYLLAAWSAALSVPLWALQFAGWLPLAVLRGPAWHAHEMLFGYTLAVVVGFLFTAGRNWSGQPTPTGRTLQALALLWLAGRVLVLTPWTWAALLANAAFPLAAAWYLGRALLAGQNRRNYFFVGLLLALSLAAAVLHATQAGWVSLPSALGAQLGLDVVLVIVSVMAGRVVPMFSSNGVPGLQAKRHDGLEKAATGSVLLLLALDLLGSRFAGDTTLSAVLALAATAAASVHAWRWWLWQPLRTVRVPLVWVLHLAYAFVPLHLVLRALAAAGWVHGGPATHALTVGAIGLLTLGMMTRSARGHTGRPLQADRADITAYGLVAAAAAVRVLLPLLWPATTVPAALLSALLWSAGFLTFALHYGPWLCRARLDGRPG